MELSHDKADLNLLSESPTTAMIVIRIIAGSGLELILKTSLYEKLLTISTDKMLS